MLFLLSLLCGRRTLWVGIIFVYVVFLPFVVLPCFELHCAVLRCVVLRFLSFRWLVLCCFALSFVTLRCVVFPLCCVALCCAIIISFYTSCVALYHSSVSFYFASFRVTVLCCVLRPHFCLSSSPPCVTYVDFPPRPLPRVTERSPRVTSASAWSAGSPCA